MLYRGCPGAKLFKPFRTGRGANVFSSWYVCLLIKGLGANV